MSQCSAERLVPPHSGNPSPRATWHVPLMMKGTIPVTDLISVVATAIVFAWLLNNTAGSVLLAMLMLLARY